MSLGSYVRSLRESRQLTLRAVEKESGISNAYLSQLETDKIKKPSPVCLYKLSKLYGISYDDLMKKAGYPLPDSREANRIENTSAMAARGRSMRTSPISQALGDLTKEEEESLLEYLAFLKSRRKSTSRISESGRAD
jgi:transcriptional regulator with XRE-family HTH domain